MSTYFDHVRHNVLDRHGVAMCDGKTIHLDFWHPTDRKARRPVFTCSVPAEATGEQQKDFERAVAIANRDFVTLL